MSDTESGHSGKSDGERNIMFLFLVAVIAFDGSTESEYQIHAVEASFERETHIGKQGIINIITDHECPFQVFIEDQREFQFGFCLLRTFKIVDEHTGGCNGAVRCSHGIRCALHVIIGIFVRSGNFPIGRDFVRQFIIPFKSPKFNGIRKLFLDLKQEKRNSSGNITIHR